MDLSDLAFFDPLADWSIIERGLPHWEQPGCVVFVTWRLGDSLPEVSLRQLALEIDDALTSMGLNPNGDWKQQLAQMNAQDRGRLQWRLFATRDKYLDAGLGECLLSSPESAQIVLTSLLHFDSRRYFLTDLVVMPNHAHFCCAFASEDGMLKQCNEWKRFTGRKINSAIGRRGEFWQVDQFDHLIRSPEQFDHYRRYIAANPISAGLAPGTYLHFQKSLAN